MKGLLLVLVVLALGGGAYYYFVADEGEAEVAGSRYGDGNGSNGKAIDSLAGVYDDPDAEVVPTPKPDLGGIDDTAPPAESNGWSGPLPKTAETLDKSDVLAKSAAGFLATDFSQWLVPQEQLRKWVQAVDLMADGDIPTKNRPLDYQREKFEIRKDGKQLYDVAENHQRWNGLVETVTLIEPGQAAAVYRKWTPLLEEAYQELGRSGTFDARFRKMLDRVIAARALEALPEFKQPHVYYVYADKALEKESALQKWLWRIGSNNMQALQDFSSELKAAL